jgi:hypothetical protein
VPERPGFILDEKCTGKTCNKWFARESERLNGCKTQEYQPDHCRELSIDTTITWISESSSLETSSPVES